MRPLARLEVDTTTSNDASTLLIGNGIIAGVGMANVRSCSVRSGREIVIVSLRAHSAKRCEATLLLAGPQGALR